MVATFLFSLLSHLLQECFIIVICGAFGIMAFEPKITRFGDALWWSLVTATTVSYGDISPQTIGGRILTGILMIAGIGFLGILTSSIATFFMNRLIKGEEKKSVVDEQIEYVKKKLDDLDNLDYEDLHGLWNVIVNIWEQKRSLKTEKNQQKGVR